MNTLVYDRNTGGRPLKPPLTPWYAPPVSAASTPSMYFGEMVKKPVTPRVETTPTPLAAQSSIDTNASKSHLELAKQAKSIADAAKATLNNVPS